MEVKAEVLKAIEEAIAGIVFGSVTLIIQDSKLIQMDKAERVRFIDSLRRKPELELKTPAPLLRNRILASLNGLRYGQAVFVIKDGVIVQIERTEKLRVPSLEGIYGEGI